MEKSSIKQIGSIHLPSLVNDAHFIYMKNVEERMEENEAVKATASVKTAVGALKAAVAEEDKYLVLSKKSSHTKQLAAKDKERDDIFRGYRTAVKGHLHAPTKEMAEAAADLWQHLKDYNIDPDMQLERETSRIMNLVDDLEKKYAAQVTLLGLKPYAEALGAVNKMVEELLTTRTDDRSKQIAGVLRKARAATDEAYQNAVRLINAVVVVGTEKDFTALIDFLNENIKRYKEQVMTRPKKKDDNDGEKPKDKKGKKGKNEKPNTGGIGQEPGEKGILIDGVRKTVVKAVVTNDLDERYLLVLQLDTAGKELLQVYFVAEGNKKVNDMTRESDVYWVVSYDKDGSCVFFTTNVGKDQKCKAGTLLYDIDMESGRYRVDVTTAQVGKSNGKTGDGNAHTFAVRIDGTAEVKK
mgnify:FL=1